jgi:rare lipoprotein A
MSERPGGSGGRTQGFLSKALIVCLLVCLGELGVARAGVATTSGLASWYGEEYRGKLMANGKPFDPDKFTAASWLYPLGAKVKVTRASGSQPARTVVVTITDRGPARQLVRDGCIIDLSHSSFKELAPPHLGLVAVAVEPLK